MTLPRTCWVKFDEWEQCLLHAWSTFYEEFENGPGLFPVGVVERRRGPLKSVDVKDIHLTIPPEWRTHTCVVCRKEINDKSIVTQSCWKEAGLGSDDHVHITCLQALLGRPLVRDDFTDDPINQQWSPAMMPRLYHIDRYLAVLIVPNVIELFRDNGGENIGDWGFDCHRRDHLCQVRWIDGQVVVPHGGLPLDALKRIFLDQ